MQIKLLKEIVSSIVGNSASKIVDLLYEKSNVNEFLISKKLALTINQTRNILYKLSDEGLVSFVRKKDNKKGGWYTYFWTLNSGKSLLKFKENLVKSIEGLNSKVSLRQNGRYYFCVNCRNEFDEENALLNDYSCPECGEALQLKDNSQEIDAMKKEIAKHQAILDEVEVELGLIGEKDQKTKDRRMKAAQKKKAVERAVRKKERDKLKNKIAKPKKKTAKKAGKR